MTEALLEREEKEMVIDMNPKISFIVPVYKVPKDLYKRCLMSLQDQDYQNIEIITVFDGPDEELMDVATSLTGIKIIEIPHGGACAARNAGFKASTGDVISFFNSDYIAKAGMVQMWIEELLDHPDCGFVYGPYEYLSAQRAWYPSKEFNPWLIEQSNYVDCGFPIWRKHVVEWDENVKSLQDWDFWIRVVKKGVKGHFLGREISYAAAMVREGGLSEDSNNNWIDRVKFVKEKNKIYQSPICVTSLGAANHGIEIAKMIGADFRDDTIFKPNEYKALYMIGFYMKPGDRYNGHAEILAHFENKIKVIHFVGADVYWIKKLPYDGLRLIVNALNKKCNAILCEDEKTWKELSAMGFYPEIVPIPPYNDYELKPLPEKFSVATFMTNKSDFDKYCKEETLSIIRSMPDVPFTIYGDYGSEVGYPNVQYVGTLGKEEWKEYVYANSCLLRIVRHDTMPISSNEFILAGRDVVTNIPGEYMDVVDTSGKEEINTHEIFEPGLNYYHWPESKAQIVKKIRDVRDRSLSQEERLVKRAYYKKLLDRDKYIERIRNLCGEK